MILVSVPSEHLMVESHGNSNTHVLSEKKAADPTEWIDGLQTLQIR